MAWPYAVTTAVLLSVWVMRVEQPVAQLLDLATFWATLPALALVVVAILARDGRAVLLLALPAVTCVRPRTAYRRLVEAGFDDAQRDAGQGMGFTWPADRRMPPLVRIDWVLTRELTATSASVGDGRGSDHHPVVVDVAFDAEER